LKALKLHVAFVYLFLYAPITVLVLFSFNNNARNVKWSGFTFEWYGRLLHNESLHRALWNSVQVGLLATLCAAVLGTMTALALTRYRFKGRSTVTALVFLPMAIPEIVMGTSLLTFFVGLGVQLSIVTVIFSHVAFCVGYCTATIRSRLKGTNFEIEEAAADLGATPWQCFWLVTFPRILPGVLSGCLLAFTLSLDDFVVTFFTAGIGAGTLPLKIYSMVKFGVTPEINAISTLTLLVTLSALMLSQWTEQRE
jgi:ABC-type spermidine/putrescine transport system permease subunit II